MNTYRIDITLESGEVVNHEIEALVASVNYQNGVIEAAIAEGQFTVIKIPTDWVRIEADQELGEVPVAVPPPVVQEAATNAPVPPPVATAPPGQ